MSPIANYIREMVLQAHRDLKSAKQAVRSDLDNNTITSDFAKTNFAIAIAAQKLVDHLGLTLAFINDELEDDKFSKRTDHDWKRYVNSKIQQTEKFIDQYSSPTPAYPEKLYAYTFALEKLKKADAFIAPYFPDVKTMPDDNKGRVAQSLIED